LLEHEYVLHAPDRQAEALAIEHDGHVFGGAFAAGRIVAGHGVLTLPRPIAGSPASMPRSGLVDRTWRRNRRSRRAVRARSWLQKPRRKANQRQVGTARLGAYGVRQLVTRHARH